MLMEYFLLPLRTSFEPEKYKSSLEGCSSFRLCDELVTSHMANTPLLNRLAPVYPEHKTRHPGLEYSEEQPSSSEPLETPFKWT